MKPAKPQPPIRVSHAAIDATAAAQEIREAALEVVEWDMSDQELSAWAAEFAMAASTASTLGLAFNAIRDVLKQVRDELETE